MKSIKLQLGNAHIVQAHPMTALNGLVYEITGIPAIVSVGQVIRLAGQSVYFHMAVCRGERSIQWEEIV